MSGNDSNRMLRFVMVKFSRKRFVDDFFFLSLIMRIVINKLLVILNIVINILRFNFRILIKDNLVIFLVMIIVLFIGREEFIVVFG